MKNAPLLSVVIPTHNYARFLGDAIPSALEQFPGEVEVIVVDDASTDNPEKVCEGFGAAVRCVRLPEHGGPAAARNRGLREARGEFTAFLDADDIFLLGGMARLREALAADPGAGAARGRFVQVGQEDFARMRRDEAGCRAQAVPCWLAGAILFRRSGMFSFDESLHHGEFIQYVSRARDEGVRFLEVDEAIFLRRVHGGNKMLTTSGYTNDFARLLKERLDRLRSRSEAAGR